MPAVSEKQREVMAIAEHEPSKLYKRNRSVLKMSKSQLHDYAKTKALHKKMRVGSGTSHYSDKTYKHD